MHLGGADADLARQGQKEHVGIGQFGRSRVGRDQRIVEIARQIVQRLGPAVALVSHKAEQHAERHRLRLVLAADGELDSGERRRGIGKAGALDQEPRHLDLRVRAGLEPPVELEHAEFVEKDRAVRLLQPGAANRQLFRHRRAVVARGLQAADFAAVERQPSSRARSPPSAPGQSRPATERRPGRPRGETGAARRA